MEENTKKQRLIEKDTDPKIENYKVEDLKNGKSVSIFKLLCHFTKRWEVLILILALLGSAGTGFAMPLFSFIFGRTLNNLSEDIKDLDDFFSIMKQMSLDYVYLGAAVFFLSFLMTSCWGIIGKTLSNRLKSEYFHVIMSQEQGWFDKVNSFEFATKVQAQTKLIETGMGEKIGFALVSSVMCVTSISIGFLTSWKLSAALCGLLPFMSGAGYFITKGRMQEQNTTRKSYEKAGGIAEETIYNIKTVASFCNIDYEIKRYDQKLIESMKAGIQDGFKTAFGLFAIFFIIYFSYTVSIWYGSHLIHDGSLNVITGKPMGAGDVITVLISVVFGAMSMGQTIPNIKAISTACSAAGEFFELFERKLEIEKKNNELKKNSMTLSNNDVNGKVEFKKVSFSYPTALNTKVFEEFDLEIEAGKKIAIVGSSGSGKSTLVNLIEKLYDPSNGAIYLDGYNYNDISAENLRNLIGYVSQEPVLFNYSIRENIIFGRENVTDEEINEALYKSKAEFINDLPGRLDYIVGIKGSKLSGGQKQRIAIARAILRKPKLLILDEATSALDNHSEKEIQRALNSISEGITTIIIAHRLSTVINADRIVVLNQGKIVEEGTHEQLMNNKSHYHSLFQSQIVDNYEFMENNTDFTKEANELLSNLNINNETSNSRDRKISKISDTNNNDDQDEEERLISLLNVEEDKIQDKKKFNDAKQKFFQSSRKKLISYLSEHKCLCTSAGLVAALCGTIWPIYGSLLTDAITALAKPADQIINESFKIAMEFLVFGSIASLIGGSQNYLFVMIGEILCRKLRNLVYNKYLRLHLGFYDESYNTPGALLTKLSTDTLRINGIALTVVGVYIQTLVSLALGLGLGFFYDWRLSLVCLIFVPFIAITAGLRFKVMQGFSNVDDKIETEAGAILSESVINTKTIYSYNFQNKIVNYYSDIVGSKSKRVVNSSIVFGLLYGISQFIIYGAFATLYYVGALLIYKQTLLFPDMNKAIFCIIFSINSLGAVQMYVGDAAKSQEALVSLYKVINKKSAIDPLEERSAHKTEKLSGKIEFKNVKFVYPTRPRHPIFKNLNFVIEPGQKVAFVGPSGSGKSSIVQLIERFYDVTEGEILIDGVNIKDHDIPSLRKNIGLVLQEPVLFKANIEDNIRYGKLDASKEEIEDSAKKAYISDLLQGADVVDKNIFSGGQKQRIAIARAIIKNPSILLLDEATSALDKNSEKIVQEALDKAMENRTSIVVAHRLSTIQNSDVIFYLEHGNIIESGSHEELIALKGKYYSLYMSGSKDKGIEI